MGARVAWRDGAVEVEGGELTGLAVDLSALPDQVPTLAALAPFAKGTTRIYNVSHLRIKESDRLRALATGLGRLGVPVEELPDGLRIPGCWAGGAPPARVGSPAGEPVVLDPVGDHRIAMAFALVGLRRPGVAVAHPEVVAKSYPGFWRDLDALLGAG
jgi:3-phosphoshikimate 1-carboxyvinyltransferase